MEHTVGCPCCGGDGKSGPYLTTGCHICASTGHVVTEVFGDYTKFAFPEQPDSFLEIDILENCPEIAEAVWEWVVEHHKNENWWLVHAKFPALEAIEDILLDNGMITVSDIPGGSNNALTDRHLADAKAYQNTLNTQTGDKSMSRPTSYRDGMRKQLYNQIMEETAVTSAPATTGEPKMSKTPVDKLKSGARIAGDAIKEGAAIGTVTAANAAVVDFIEFKMGDKWPEIFKTPHGRATVELMIPLLITLLLEFDDHDKIPGKDKIQLAAQYALKGTSSDAVQKVTELMIRHGGMLLQAYTEAGTQLAESHQIAEEVSDFAEVIEKMKIQEAVEVGGKAL